MANLLARTPPSELYIYYTPIYQKDVMKESNRKEKFDADQYRKENVEPYLKSKGLQKVWNYFLEITKTEYFCTFVKESRQKYHLPAKGLKPDVDGYYHDPKNIDQPKLREEIISKICKKYELHYADYSEVVERYIYFNKFLQPIDSIGSCGLFRVSDVIDEKEEPFGELFQTSDDSAYPIAIRISPYASQNDLVDFIKNKVVWEKEIVFLQNKYKKKDIKIGRVRAKDKRIQARNDFIYKNKSLERKSIMSLTNAKFKTDLDYGEICKIISIENNKRKELSS